MHSLKELRLLASVYLAYTGVSEAALGVECCGNQKFIKGLLAGGDCKASNAERASQFFHRNWPEGVLWPPGVARCPAHKASAMG